jgi:hypothetical protein
MEIDIPLCSMKNAGGKCPCLMRATWKSRGAAELNAAGLKPKNAFVACCDATASFGLKPAGGASKKSARVDPRHRRKSGAGRAEQGELGEKEIFLRITTRRISHVI